MVVGGSAGGLHHEHIAGTNVLLDLDGDFTVRETAYVGVTQGGMEVLCNFRGKLAVGVACENHEVWMMVLHSVPVGMG